MTNQQLRRLRALPTLHSVEVSPDESAAPAVRGMSTSPGYGVWVTLSDPDEPEALLLAFGVTDTLAAASVYARATFVGTGLAATEDRQCVTAHVQRGHLSGPQGRWQPIGDALIGVHPHFDLTPRNPSETPS